MWRTPAPSFSPHLRYCHEWHSEWKSCLFVVVNEFRMCPCKYFSVKMNNPSLPQFQHCSWSVVGPLWRHCFCWCYCYWRCNAGESEILNLHLFHWPRVGIALAVTDACKKLAQVKFHVLIQLLFIRTIFNESAIELPLCLLVVYDLSRQGVCRWLLDKWWFRWTSES